jgi:hypothetical protein
MPSIVNGKYVSVLEEVLLQATLNLQTPGTSVIELLIYSLLLDTTSKGLTAVELTMTIFKGIGMV